MAIQLTILAVILVFGFSLFTFLRKWADSFVIIAFAIGFVVNANLFTPFTGYGIEVGPIIFAADSILYTMFLYCICVKALHYTVKEVKLVVYSSIVAIIISAFIEFFANLSKMPVLESEYVVNLVKRLLEYIFSAGSSLLACWYMVWVIKKMEAKGISRYLILPAAMIGGALIDSTLYYCLDAAIYGGFGSTNGIEYFAKTLAGSWIGKIVACLFSIFCYFINDKFWVPNEIKNRELQNKKD